VNLVAGRVTLRTKKPSFSKKLGFWLAGVAAAG